MSENPWSGQQHHSTAHDPHSGYAPYCATAHHTDHVPSRPSAHWPLVVVAVVVSGVLAGAVAVYHAVQVGRRFTAGDVHGAARASRLAKLWASAGITIGALLLAVATPFLALAGSPAFGASGTPSAPIPVEAAQPTTPSGTVDPTLEKPEGLDPGQSEFFDGMQADLELAVDSLDRGDDPTSRCIAVLVTAEGFATGFESAAAKATEQCGREIPLAWAAQQLDSAAAEGDPLDAATECATAKVALDSVEERFADPRAGELRTRSEQVCR